MAVQAVIAELNIMKILIIGRTEILYNTALLLAQRHDICGIITAPAVPEYLKSEEDFKALATRLGCPFLLTRHFDKSAEHLVEATRPDIGISINWVEILKAAVCSAFPFGILNAHCGDLPRYRGNAAMNWAIIRNEPFIALTIHQMNGGELDSGDILIQKKMALSPQTTIADIVDFAVQSAPALFSEVLDALARNTANPIPQVSRKVAPFRCYPRLPVDSKIDWRNSASEIDALVRASTHPYRGAYTFLRIADRLHRVTIWKTRVLSDQSKDLATQGHVIKNDGESGESWVYTGKGIIALLLVQYEEGAEFQPGKYWKSIRMRLGLDIEEEIYMLSCRISALQSP